MQIKSKRYLTGFTLIELLVTLAIMGVMAVIAIPAFSSFGDKADFSQKMDQAQELINKTIIQSQNPTQNNNGASINISWNSSTKVIGNITLSNLNMDSSGVPVNTGSTVAVQTISFPSYYKIVYSFDNSAASTSLVCKNVFSNCCISSNANFNNSGNSGGTIPNVCYNGASIWFVVTNSKTGQSATFTKLENPTRVTHIIQ